MLMLSLVRSLTVLIPWMSNLAIWALHRRFHVREGADDREQGRQGAVSDAAVASAPILVPLNHPPAPQTKGDLS